MGDATAATTLSVPRSQLNAGKEISLTTARAVLCVGGVSGWTERPFMREVLPLNEAVPEDQATFCSTLPLQLADDVLLMW